MGVVGIVVNPNSGRDVRRLVSHATVFNNAEKINIARRIIVGILGTGDHDIYLMPDRFNMGLRTLETFENNERIMSHASVLKMPVRDEPQDTSNFTKIMIQEKNADVMIVMGGDGTSRAMAKEIGDVPMIPISTGTNNVYPIMIEGTSVSFAASAIANGLFARDEIAPRGKRIDIAINDEKHDIALIDAVISRVDYIGSKAIINHDDISTVMVTQGHPASIGFSALAGCVETVGQMDDHGLFIQMDWKNKKYLAAISAGVLTEFGVKESRKVSIGESVVLKPDYHGTVAVDGEREVTFRAGDTVTLSLSQNGPRKVNVRDVVERAALKGFFRIK